MPPVLQHVEIDCGIEIWHAKLTCHAGIFNKPFSKSVTNITSVSYNYCKTYLGTLSRFLTYM